jgi:hypothetical protein
MFAEHEATAKRVWKRIVHEAPLEESTEERDKRAIALLKAFGEYCSSQTCQDITMRLCPQTPKPKAKPCGLTS